MIFHCATEALRRTELTVERPLAKCETRARSCCMAKVSVYFDYLFTVLVLVSYQHSISPYITHTKYKTFDNEKMRNKAN